jgi:hypothetical protein
MVTGDNVVDMGVFLQPCGIARDCLVSGRGLGPGRGGDNPIAAGHGGLDGLRTFGAAQLR